MTPARVTAPRTPAKDKTNTWRHCVATVSRLRANNRITNKAVVTQIKRSAVSTTQITVA